MTLSKIKLSFFFLVSLRLGSCQASVIDFEDVVPGNFNNLGYQGFDWGGVPSFPGATWFVQSNDSGGIWWSHSGNKFAWSSSGASRLDIIVHGGGTFDLTSFWVRRGDGLSGPKSVARGYLNGSEVFEQAFAIQYGYDYSQITLDFTNIDRFTLTNNSSNLLIDDITVANVSAAPIPTAIWLFGSSLVGLLCRKSVKRSTTWFRRR